MYNSRQPSTKSPSGYARIVRAKQFVAKIKRKSANKIVKEESCSITNIGSNKRGLTFKHVNKFPFKVMVWTGITFQGVTVILPPKTSFDAAFYHKNLLPIVKPKIVSLFMEYPLIQF